MSVKILQIGKSALTGVRQGVYRVFDVFLKVSQSSSSQSVREHARSFSQSVHVKAHIRRRGTVAHGGPPAPSVPEAPVDTHRLREATAVDSAETTIVPACPNFATGAHAILAHQSFVSSFCCVLMHRNQMR